MEIFNYVLVLLIVTLTAIMPHVQGSGSLYDPPNRAVMWKYGYHTQKNYNYMQLNCGGNKQQMNGPFQCGLCGDPYELSKDHELGGKFGSGTISRYYPAGIREMQVKIELLAFEKGFFEFHICVANNLSVTQECLDQNPLPIKEGYLAGTPMRFHPKGAGDFRLTVAIPPNLTCDRCVLQWRYHTANSWGIDPQTLSQGIGKGPQEEFRNCADIRIGGIVPDSVLNNPFFAPPDAKVASQIDKPTDQRKKLASQSGIQSIAAKPETIDRFSSSARAILHGVGGTRKVIQSQPIDVISNVNHSASDWVDGTLNPGGARQFLVPNVENAGKRIVKGRILRESTQQKSRLNLMPAIGTMGLSDFHGSAITTQNQMDRQANTIATGLHMNGQSNTASQLDVNKRIGLLAIDNVLDPTSKIPRRGGQILKTMGASGIHSRIGSHALGRTDGIDGQIGGGLVGQIEGGINNLWIGDINKQTVNGISERTAAGSGSQLSSGLNAQMTRAIVGQTGGGISGKITDKIVSQKAGNLAGDIVSLTASGHTNKLIHGQMLAGIDSQMLDGKGNINLRTVSNTILLPDSLQVPPLSNPNQMGIHSQTRGSELNLKGKPADTLQTNDMNINKESGWFALDNVMHPSLKRQTLDRKAGIDGRMETGIEKTRVGGMGRHIPSGRDTLLSGGLTVQLTGGTVDQTTGVIGGQITDKGVNLQAGKLDPQRTLSHTFRGIDRHGLDGQVSSGLGNQIAVGMDGLMTGGFGSLLSGGLLNQISGGIDGLTSTVLANKISSGIEPQLSNGLGGKTLLDRLGSDMSSGLDSHISGGFDGQMSTGLANQLSSGMDVHVLNGLGSQQSGGLGSHLSGGLEKQMSVGFDSHIPGGLGGHMSTGSINLTDSLGVQIGSGIDGQMTGGLGNHVALGMDRPPTGVFSNRVSDGMVHNMSGALDSQKSRGFDSHVSSGMNDPLSSGIASKLPRGSGNHISGWTDGRLSGGGGVNNQVSRKIDRHMSGGVGSHMSGDQLIGGLDGHISGMIADQMSGFLDAQVSSGIGKVKDMGIRSNNFVAGRAAGPSPNPKEKSSIMVEAARISNAASTADMGKMQLDGSHINILTDKVNTNIGTGPSSPSIVFNELHQPIAGGGTVGGPDIQYDQSLTAIQPNSGRQRIFLVRASRPNSVIMPSSDAINRGLTFSESGQAITNSVRMSGDKTLEGQSMPFTVANNKGMLAQINTGKSKQTSTKAMTMADSSFINNLDILRDTTFSNSLTKGINAHTVADGVVSGIRTAEVIDPLRTQSLRSDGSVAADNQFLPTGHIGSVTDAHTLNAMVGGNGITEIDSFRKSLITGSLRHGGGLNINDKSSNITTNQRDIAISSNGNARGILDSSLKTKAESNKHAPQDKRGKSKVMGGLELTVSNLLREAHQLLNSNASGFKDATHGSNEAHGSVSGALNVVKGGHAHDTHGALGIGSKTLAEILGGSTGPGRHFQTQSTDILGHSQSNELGQLLGASNNIGNQENPAIMTLIMDSSPHIRNRGFHMGMDVGHTGNNRFNILTPDNSSRGSSKTLGSTMINKEPSNAWTPLFGTGLGANEIRPMINVPGIDFGMGSHDLGSSLVTNVNDIGLGTRNGIQNFGSHGISQAKTTPKSAGIFMNQAASTVAGPQSISGIHTTVGTKSVAENPAVIGLMDHSGTRGSDIITQGVDFGIGSAGNIEGGLGPFDIFTTDTLSNKGRTDPIRHAQHVDSILNIRDILPSGQVAETILDTTSIGHSSGTGSRKARTLGGSNIDFNSIIQSTAPAAVAIPAQPMQNISPERIVDLSDVTSRISDVGLPMGYTAIGKSSNLNGGSGSMLTAIVRQSGEVQTGGRFSGERPGRTRIIGRNNQLATHDFSNIMTDGLNIEQQINSFNFENIPSSSVIGAGIQMSGGGGMTTGFGPRGNERSRNMRREGRRIISGGNVRSGSRRIAGISGEAFRVERDPRTGFKERIPTRPRPDTVDMRRNRGERVVIHDGHRHSDGGTARSDPKYFLDMSGSASPDMRLVERTVIRERPTGGRGRVSGRRTMETRGVRMRSEHGRSTGDRNRLDIRRSGGVGGLMSLGNFRRGTADRGGRRRSSLSQFRVRGSSSTRSDERGRTGIRGRGSRIGESRRGDTSIDGRRRTSRRRGRGRSRGSRRSDDPRIVPLGAGFPYGMPPFDGSFPMMGPSSMMDGPFGGMPFDGDMGPGFGPGMGPDMGLGMGPGMGMGDGMSPFSPMGFDPGMM